MDTPPNDTWSNLAAEYHDVVVAHDSAPVASEQEFREQYIQCCNAHRERDAQRLAIRFRRQHQPIIQFAVIIDDTWQLDPTRGIQSVIWQLLKRAVQIALDNRRRLAAFISDTEPLNAQLVALDTALLSRYPNDHRVQRPLQQLFRAYMKCYSSMFSDLISADPALSLDSFATQLEVTKISFQTCLTDLKNAVQTAEADEKRRLQAPNSPSSMCLSDDASLSTTIVAQFVHVASRASGQYGEVSIVREQTSGTLYAQKLIRVRNAGDRQEVETVTRQFKSEVEIMRKLRHEHIAHVHLDLYEGAIFRLIMLPVAECDLREYLNRCAERSFPRDDIRHLDQWFGCLISALTYAHVHKTKHEDIKPSNILIKNHRPYLADFGNAVDFSKLETSVSSDLPITGTPVYWPPEGRNRRGRSADIFALGCVFSEMLTVRQHRSVADYRDARYRADTDYGYGFRNNLSGVTAWLHNLPAVDERDSIQALLLEVILQMITVDPDERPEAKLVRREFRRGEESLFCYSCGA